MTPPSKSATERGMVHSALRTGAIACAYAGGAVISAIGLMSAVHIVGLWLFSSPIRGDFELVEFGIAIAGSLFLPYCQLVRGHIIVDFFTQTAGPRTIGRLDALGAFLMAVVLLLVGWRTGIAIFDMYRNGETTTLRALPLWIAYAAMTPGFLLAGFIALGQALGVVGEERVESEIPT